ncbi:hypothetical protein ACQ4LE_010146 [Meloidogyne hapla]
MSFKEINIHPLSHSSKIISKPNTFECQSVPENKQMNKSSTLRKSSFWSKKFNGNSNQKQKQGKRELIRRTLAEDYPGLDYLGVHSVLNARYSWYRILWFSILSVCLLIGLFTIYRIIHEYVQVPSATLINVKSVDKLLLPQLTVCPTNAANIDLEKLEQNLFVTNKNQIEYSKEDVFNFAFYMIAGSGFQFGISLKTLFCGYT